MTRRGHGNPKNFRVPFACQWLSPRFYISKSAPESTELCCSQKQTVVVNGVQDYNHQTSLQCRSSCSCKLHMLSSVESSHCIILPGLGCCSLHVPPDDEKKNTLGKFNTSSLHIVPNVCFWCIWCFPYYFSTYLGITLWYTLLKNIRT